MINYNVYMDNHFSSAMLSDMKTVPMICAIFGIAMQAVSAQAQQVSSDEVRRGEPRTVEVMAGTPHSVYLDETPGSVVVGNPEIADVNIVGTHSIVIIPKKIGLTGIVVTDKEGKLITSISVPVNAPNTVAIWNAGVMESHWCTAKACLTDAEVNKKNEYIEQTKEKKKTSPVADMFTAIGLILGGQIAASADGAAAQTVPKAAGQ